MLSKAYFLAKFRFDTAENEPAKNLQKFANFPNFADPNPITPSGGTGAGAREPRGSDDDEAGGKKASRAVGRRSTSDRHTQSLRRQPQ